MNESSSELQRRDTIRRTLGNRDQFNTTATFSSPRSPREAVGKGSRIARGHQSWSDKNQVPDVPVFLCGDVGYRWEVLPSGAVA
jgi:hypothetical protein